MTLVTEIYKLTEQLPEEEKFGLTNQLRRAAVSIPSNIAEGWGNKYHSLFLRYLRIAQGSLYEVETQVIIAKNLNYVVESKKIDEIIVEVSKMLSALIKSVKNRMADN